jgi:hypothetical protein
VAETIVIRLIFCGFRCTGKAMGQVYQCWRVCREINVFPRFESQRVLYPFVTYLLTPIIESSPLTVIMVETVGTLL